MNSAEREELVRELEATDNAIAVITEELRVANEDRAALVERLGQPDVEEPQEPAMAVLESPQPPREYRHRLVHPAHFGLEFVPHLLERPQGIEAHLLRRLPEGAPYPDVLASLCGHEYPWRRWEEVDARGNSEGLVQMCASCAHVLEQHRQVEHRRS